MMANTIEYVSNQLRLFVDRSESQDLTIEKKRNIAIAMKWLDQKITDYVLQRSISPLLQMNSSAASLSKVNSFLHIQNHLAANCTEYALPSCFDVSEKDFLACIRRYAIEHCLRADKDKVLTELATFGSKFCTGEINHNIYDVGYARNRLDPSGILGGELDLQPLEKWSSDILVTGHQDAAFSALPPVLNPLFHPSKLQDILKQMSFNIEARIAIAHKMLAEEANISFPLGNAPVDERYRIFISFQGIEYITKPAAQVELLHDIAQFADDLDDVTIVIKGLPNEYLPAMRANVIFWNTNSVEKYDNHISQDLCFSLQQTTLNVSQILNGQEGIDVPSSLSLFPLTDTTHMVSDFCFFGRFGFGSEATQNLLAEEVASAQHCTLSLFLKYDNLPDEGIPQESIQNMMLRMDLLKEHFGAGSEVDHFKMMAKEVMKLYPPLSSQKTFYSRLLTGDNGLTRQGDTFCSSMPAWNDLAYSMYFGINLTKSFCLDIVAIATHRYVDGVINAWRPEESNIEKIVLSAALPLSSLYFQYILGYYVNGVFLSNFNRGAGATIVSDITKIAGALFFNIFLNGALRRLLPNRITGSPAKMATLIKLSYYLLSDAMVTASSLCPDGKAFAANAMSNALATLLAYPIRKKIMDE